MKMAAFCCFFFFPVCKCYPSHQRDSSQEEENQVTEITHENFEMLECKFQLASSSGDDDWWWWDRMHTVKDNMLFSNMIIMNGICTHTFSSLILIEMWAHIYWFVKYIHAYFYFKATTTKAVNMCFFKIFCVFKLTVQVATSYPIVLKYPKK